MRFTSFLHYQTTVSFMLGKYLTENTVYLYLLSSVINLEWCDL